MLFHLPIGRTDRVSAPGNHFEYSSTGLQRGIEHDLLTRRAVWYQAAGIAALALIGMLPAVWEIGEHLLVDQSPGVAPWAYLVLWLGVVQLGYVLYLVQLPDWSSVWVAAHACLLIAAVYAVGFGIGLSAGGESAVIVALGLADRHHTGQLTGWCLIMLSVSLLVSYLLGRYSLRWHRRFLRLHAPSETAAPASTDTRGES